MKIQSIKIQNFRGFKEELIELESYTCFVGSNGSGKSTVLAALSIFFRQYIDSNGNSKLKADDFHHRNVKLAITITLTFVDLSAAAKADLADYVRDDKLIVAAVATYDPATEFANVKQVGWRLGIPEFAPGFRDEADGKKVPELVAVYDEIRKKFPSLKEAKQKPKMLEQLRQYEEGNKADMKLLRSDDEFYGARGSSKLAPYIQWIYVPAVKEAAEEAAEKKNSALGLLLGRAIRSKVDFSTRIDELRVTIEKDYREMIEAQQSALDELSISLQLKMQDWAHPGATARVMWKLDPEKSVSVEEPLAFMQVGERGYEGELFRFGHGMQRSCMLTLLHQLAISAGVAMPSLVMGIEEPELYQHPPQARYLSEVLQTLAKSGSQILACSHSPLFIPGDNIEAIRVVRESQSPPQSTAARLTYADLTKRLEECGDKLYRPTGLLAKLITTLNPTINEMFFCRTHILVESMEDVAYLSTYLELEGRMNDFRRYGCRIVSVGKKSEMLRPALIARSLKIPVYGVFDADTDSEAKWHEIHKQDNKRLLTAFGHSTASDWPEADLWLDGVTTWSRCIGEVVKGELGNQWGPSYQKACAKYGQAGDLDKNALVIADTLEDAWKESRKSASLSRLAHVVADFARDRCAVHG